MQPLTLLIFTAYLLVSYTQSAKILFISPSLTNSIVISTGRIADVLVQAGHDVTFWIPEMFRENKINGTKLAKIVRMNNISDAFESFFAQKSDLFYDLSNPLFTRAINDQAICDYCEALLNRKEELKVLKEQKFDLAFSDSIELCFVGLAHYLGIPKHIWISTGVLSDSATWIAGIPQPLSYIPAFEDTLYGPRMNVWQRAYNIFMYSAGRLLASYQFRQEQLLFQKFDKNIPDLVELARSSPVWFTISDEFINPAAPTLEKVINIAGVGIEKPNELSQELKELMMKGRKGVIFFSLGSLTSTHRLCPIKREILYKAFASFSDYHFIVKVNVEDELSQNLTRNYKNIAIVHWVPQTDLLAHPRLKLFISHGGYNSVLESAIRGVPMITIPLFFDQFRNSKGVEYRGFGLVLERAFINTQHVKSLISEILHNPTYTKKAQRLAKLFREKPNRPSEMVVKWTNFVLENGDLPELIPEGARQGLIEYFCLDVLFFVTTSFVLFLLAIIYFCKKFFALAYDLTFYVKKSKIE